MTKEERAEIKRQEAIEIILGRFIGDSDLHESCQALLDCLGIKYTAISPATLPPEAFFDKKFVEKNAKLLGKIDNISVAGIATQDTFLTEERLTISREEMEAQLENDHYKEMAFFALDVNSSLTRTELALITRAFNRRMHFRPVVLFFRYGSLLTMATCERTEYIQKGHEGEKVGKVTILRNIDCSHPHHGHVVILGSLDISSCKSSFDAVYEHWINTFSNELLTKKFYQELSDWFAWAIKNVKYPNDLDDPNDDDKYNHENVIRLVTRLIFVWFLKEKHLIPEEFFNESYIRENLIKDFNPNAIVDLFYKSTESKYYKAILQNLFFATLNCPIIDPTTGEATNRHFGTGGADDSNSKVMKHKDYFMNPDLFVELVNKKVPFLNGGLFDCLDDSPKHLYYDGFSEKEEVSKSLVIPDYLFFGEEMGKNIDLSEFYGDKKKKKVSARGIIDILKRYSFTIEENTPFDQEVSLDPELLGKVFENLLASYNPETKKTARKQTGSFYTPRDIVQYMVDESIVEHLKRTVDQDSEQLFRDLVSYSTGDLELSEEMKASIMKSIYNCKVLDPACGSGAFPVGMLQQMVHILSRIDPDNKKWEELIIDAATAASHEAFKAETKEEREEKLADINSTFDEELNYPDYARKLYIIENCIHGVDIQPIAIQISHLRFFISLIVDQKENSDPTKNFGIRPLPNLEAKFVAANSLIPLNKTSNLFTTSPQYVEMEKRLHEANHKIFTAKSPQQKAAWKKNLHDRRQEMVDMLVDGGFVDSTAGSQIASWDMFNQNSSASFFDSEWMFGIREGFDIVIGNPPYGATLSEQEKAFYRKIYPETQFKIDTYSLFTLLSLNLLCPLGICYYIIPNTLLDNYYEEEVRKKLLKNKVYEINDLSDKVFEAAVVHSMIIGYGKVDEDINYSIKANLSKTLKGEITLIEKDFFRKQPQCTFAIRSSGNDDFYEQVKKDCVRLYDVLDIRQAIKTGDDKKHISSSKIATNYKPILRGKDIQRYILDDPKLFVNYGKHLACPRSPFIFEQPKILIREAGSEITATYDDGNYYIMSSLYNAILRDPSYSLKYLLGLINSKLFQFLMYKLTFEKTEGAFTKAKIYHYYELPVKKISIEEQRPIIDLVDKILTIKKFDVKADITDLENQINQKIYSLYGISEDDLK